MSLCTTPLCATPLCATSLCATPLCATPLCAMPLCATLTPTLISIALRLREASSFLPLASTYQMKRTTFFGGRLFGFLYLFLASTHLLLIFAVRFSKDGTGKTDTFIRLMHIVLTISENPSLAPGTKFPRHPAMVVVCPTKVLKEEMAEKMIKAGLTTLAINADTLNVARKKALNLFKEALESPWL
ncbi:hypothetical protein DFH29DRAFT_999212 [Suillus ampliporus]|nr:hypothetical protein DFH29DRAFT_999212 [Suillus ampliporus]